MLLQLKSGSEKCDILRWGMFNVAEKQEKKVSGEEKTGNAFQVDFSCDD